MDRPAFELPAAYFQVKHEGAYVFDEARDLPTTPYSVVLLLGDGLSHEEALDKQFGLPPII